MEKIFIPLNAIIKQNFPLNPKTKKPIIMNEEKRKEFEEKVRPVIQWLNENLNPHVTVIITPTNAELVEGKYSTGDILDYIKD